MEQSMTKEEMQRFIYQCIRDGHDKLETFNRLLDVLGIDYPETIINK